MRNIPILVVEDDILSALETCDSLRDYGFKVTEVSGARGAYKVIDQHEPLLALVTDINLGPGADGYEIARCARAVYPDLPVIYVSASPAERQLTEGVSGSKFISKPFYSRNLTEALARMIRLDRPTLAWA